MERKGGCNIVTIGDLQQLKVAVGKGTESFPMKRGSFKYQEKLAWKHQMQTEAVTKERDGVSLFVEDPVSGESGTIRLIQEGKRIRLKMDFKKEDYNRYWITFPVGREEHFYGCGETFSKFDLKGEKVRIWVAEHQNSNRISKKIIKEKLFGKHPEQTLPFSKYESYYVQPTFVSSDHYYVHADGTSYMEFDFRKESQVTLYLRENCEIEFGMTDDFTGLSELLTEKLGRQKTLPDWIYDGVILGIQEGTDVVQKKLDEAAKYQIPVAGVWCQDWSGCRRTKFGYQVMWNWELDQELYPNLKEKIAQLRDEGVCFLGYINPFLAIEKDLYKYASEQDYCVKDQEGKDYYVTITTFPAAMVDFTNPKAYAWYKEVIKQNMIGLGMGGWMADFGEYLPPDCKLFCGEDPKLVHNTWPAIWAKMNQEAIAECKKEEEIFFFTRAGFTGTVASSAMMWNGDQHVDWSIDDGLPSVIPATLSLAMSGYGITHSDAGGYTTIMQMTRQKELLMRWEEMNAFSPLLRTHEGNQPSRNVQFDTDEELMLHLARISQLHVKLKDYLKACVTEETNRGTPVMRPLFYHYEEKAAFTEKTEYLLGRDLLVAPILKEGAVSRTCYLPKDTWVHLFTGTEYTGGSVQVEAPLGQPPVFIRKESHWLEQLMQISPVSQPNGKLGF